MLNLVDILIVSDDEGDEGRIVHSRLYLSKERVDFQSLAVKWLLLIHKYRTGVYSFEISAIC